MLIKHLLVALMVQLDIGIKSVAAVFLELKLFWSVLTAKLFTSMNSLLGLCKIYNQVPLLVKALVLAVQPKVTLNKLQISVVWVI